MPRTGLGSCLSLVGKAGARGNDAAGRDWGGSREYRLWRGVGHVGEAFFLKKKVPGAGGCRRRRKRVLAKGKFDIFLGLKYFFMERLVYDMLSLDFFFLIVSDSLRRIFYASILSPIMLV